jgi:hypothetical protein
MCVSSFLLRKKELTPITPLLTTDDIQALAGAFALEIECWKAFRELVEESISEIRVLQRQIVEEN